jgi:hypothetical protein
MTELTYEQKRSLGETRHSADTDSFADDIVPPEVTGDIATFAADLSPLPPVHIPLRKDDHAVYGWPADGVREKIRADGGGISFGWRLREWPSILLTAEFHAVWVDPEGNLVDITPDVADGETSLFVPDPAYTEPLDFDRHPPTRYLVLHKRPDRSEAIAARIARLKTGQRAYEERRARKAGQTLEEWFDDKFYPDPMPKQIAAFIDDCKSFDARLPTLPDLIESGPIMADDAASAPMVDAPDEAQAAVAATDDTDQAHAAVAATDAPDAAQTTPAAADAPDEARTAAAATDNTGQEAQAAVTGGDDAGAGAIHGDAAHEQAVPAEQEPTVDAASGSSGDIVAVADAGTPTVARDEDGADDAGEEPYDVTWLAVENIYEWSRPRDKSRNAVLRVMPET